MTSKDLKPGTRVQHKSGTIVTLDRRKRPGDSEFGLPGWWLRDEPGGLADIVIDDRESDWTVLAAGGTRGGPRVTFRTRTFRCPLCGAAEDFYFYDDENASLIPVCPKDGLMMVELRAGELGEDQT